MSSERFRALRRAPFDARTYSPPTEATILEYAVEWAARAAARAARAAKSAERHEKNAISETEPNRRRFHETQAALHRASQSRHLALVTLFSRHAFLLTERLSGRWGPPSDTETRFIDSLTSVARCAGVCIGLCSTNGPDVVLASDRMVRRAHDFEIVLGEGPVHACEKGGPLLASEREIRTRWAIYAAAVDPLGVKEIATVPLQLSDRSIGSLTAFGTTAHPIESDLGDLCTIGDAVVEVLVAEAEDPLQGPAELIVGADYRDTLNQAAGIASVQHGCSISDALALLRARAFASECDLQAVATAVVAGEMNFPRQ